MGHPAWGASTNPDFRIQKKDFAFFGENRKTDLESIKSTLWVDSSDQIQIGTFEIHHLTIFLEADLKRVFLTSGFANKTNGTQQMPYMYGNKTGPIFVAQVCH